MRKLFSRECENENFRFIPVDERVDQLCVGERAGRDRDVWEEP